MKRKENSIFAGAVQSFLLAWLFAVLIEFMIIHIWEYDLSGLESFENMSLLRVLITTIVSFLVIS